MSQQQRPRGAPRPWAPRAPRRPARFRARAKPKSGPRSLPAAPEHGRRLLQTAATHGAAAQRRGGTCILRAPRRKPHVSQGHLATEPGRGPGGRHPWTPGPARSAWAPCPRSAVGKLRLPAATKTPARPSVDNRSKDSARERGPHGRGPLAGAPVKPSQPPCGLSGRGHRGNRAARRREPVPGGLVWLCSPGHHAAPPVTPSPSSVRTGAVSRWAPWGPGQALGFVSALRFTPSRRGRETEAHACHALFRRPRDERQQSRPPQGDRLQRGRAGPGARRPPALQCRCGLLWSPSRAHS